MDADTDVFCKLLLSIFFFFVVDILIFLDITRYGVVGMSCA